MTYPEAIQFLYRMGWVGAKLGLENARKLSALAGQPQQRLRFLHVAGTNGKGSTCAMLESIYRAAGWRVGLYTSPHLVSFGERIQVNRRPIPEAEVVRLVERMQGWLREFPADAQPTFFEIATVMALCWFERQQCDLVIWETGLGGRLDATNIVKPMASIITNIQLDHEKWLGHTLAGIAREKAGIIKDNVPTLTAADAPEALAVFREVAAERRSPLTVLHRADTWLPPLDTISLALLGEHQRLNAALAVATVRALNDQLPVSEKAVCLGLSTVRWPGRFQVVEPEPGRSLVLDGAHNPAGAQTLRDALDQYFPDRRATLILATMKDKDWDAMCHILAPVAERILLAPVASERTASPADLETACRKANPGAELIVCGSLAEAVDRTGDAPLTVITGSLHFIGEAMELLRLAPVPENDERGLNDWGAAAR